jgi:glycosyltransferase involved in cell wall biosynthesis
VGSAPGGRAKLPPFVRSMGFLDKRTPAGLATLERLYAEAHFLVLPTRVDATPVVVSEANAYGVPCLASRVGGLPSIVTDDVNGRLFPPDAVAAYAAYVAETMATRGRYQELARSAFNTYETRLNWDTATRTVAELLREVAAQGRTSL